MIDYKHFSETVTITRTEYEQLKADAERLDFVIEHEVIMYKNHPHYMPIAICYSKKAGERKKLVVANSFREAIDQARKP